MNKKTLIIVAVAVVVVLAVVLGVVLAGGNDTDNTTTTTTTGKVDPTPAGKDYKLGLGVSFGDHTNAQLNMTIATVLLENGKIVACRLDAVQNKYTVDFDAESVNFTVLETKMELGDRYGMASSPYSPDNNGDGVVKEWYEQAKAFENHVVGMTPAEVAAMTTQLVNDHNISTDADLLAAGCTIQIGEFRDAVVAACNDEFAVTFTASKQPTLGIGANSADNSTAWDDNGVTVKMNVDFAASAVVDGKIVASLNDAYQPAVAIDWDNNVTDTGDQRTKREKKEDYGMAGSPYSPDNDGNGKVLEWYVQSAAFSAHVVGMTGAEVAAMETVEAGGHQITTDADLLAAGCSIQITGLMAVVSESVTNAR